MTTRTPRRLARLPLPTALAAVLVLGGSLLGCASRSAPTPVATSKIVPAQDQRVVDQVVILVDVSGSIDEEEQFPSERALLDSFVGTMPDGSYAVGVIAFGGANRQVYDAAFDRGALETYADEVEYLSDGTPLHTVLGEVQTRLEGKKSNASLIVVTDGRPSDVIGRDVSPDLALGAARSLEQSYAGTLCIHTVQIGDDAAGAAFLEQLTAVAPCGTTRSSSTLADANALQSFGRVALLTSLPQVAAGPPAAAGDDDRDGVPNTSDQCPNTPAGATVDERGCWAMPRLQFQFDSARFAGQSEETLDAKVVPVLKRNPDVRVRIDGYTDSSGDPAYNEFLSGQRANAVRDALIADGIAADRVEAMGHGAADPIAPNDTRAGREANRRTEITVLD